MLLVAATPVDYVHKMCCKDACCPLTALQPCCCCFTRPTSFTALHWLPSCNCCPQAASPVLTPRRLLPDVPPPAGLSPRDVAVLQRQQEAALQRVLEEEILKEMKRENMLQAVSGQGHRRLMEMRETAQACRPGWQKHRHRAVGPRACLWARRDTVHNQQSSFDRFVNPSTSLWLSKQMALLLVACEVHCPCLCHVPAVLFDPPHVGNRWLKLRIASA